MSLIRHLVFFKFSASSTAAQRQSCIDHLKRLPSVLPDILYYELFPLATNLYPKHHTLNAGYTLMIDSIFKDAKALGVYGPSDAHQSVVKTVIAPIREDNMVIDYPVPSGFDVEAFKQQQTAPAVRHVIAYKLKAGASASDAAGINAQFKRVQDDVPAVLSTLAGTQPAEPLFEDYPARHKDHTNVLELLAKDAAGLQQYHEHGDHDAIKEHCKPLVDGMFQFDYAVADANEAPQ